jgi:hypothetical protein
LSRDHWLGLNEEIKEIEACRSPPVWKKERKKNVVPTFYSFFSLKNNISFQNYYYKLTRVEVINQAIMIPLDMDE